MYDCPIQYALLTYQFTAKERDAESGLDEFGARYYSSALGRFMIPDWAGKPTAVPYATPTTR
jgi:RHS repeat-associated protein